MKKMSLLLFAAMLVGAAASAQSMGSSYKTALGVKFWDGAGVSLKSFVRPDHALEVIGYFYRRGTRITGLYEIHGKIADAPGLRWYIGPGAHVGIYDYDGYRGDRYVAGVDGVLGLDYKVKRAPLNFSLDWQPSYEFSRGRGFTGSWGGFAIRYTF